MLLLEDGPDIDHGVGSAPVGVNREAARRARARVRSRATRCRPDGERLLAPDGVVAQNPRMRACRRATGAGAR